MNEHPQQTDRTLRDTRILTLRIWGVVGCIVIAAVIFNLMGILAPVIEFLAVGSIIAFVMSPITNWLEHHGVNRGIGSLVALIVVVAMLVGVVCILSPILFGQIMEVLSRLPEQLRVAGGDLNEMISHAKTLNNTPLKEYLDDNLSSLVTVASKYVSQIAAELGRGVFPLITNTASQLFVIFLGLVLAYWLACDYPRMHHEVCTIIGQEKETSYRFMVAILSRSVGGYMRGMVVTSICGGILAFIGFTLIGHPYAALMAIFTGIMHLVPVVGPWVSAAIATVLGFMFSPMLALWTLIVTMVAQNVTDNVISPKVMQSSVQVHPIMSLTALVIGSALMGPIGMVIAIPLCAALKGIFVYYFENETGRQLVAYDGAVFKGTPYRDAEGNPVAAYDALGDDTFIYESELIGNETAPEAKAMPKPELDNPWIKLSGLQPDATGFFKNPFAKDDDADSNDDTKTGIENGYRGTRTYRHGYRTHSLGFRHGSICLHLQKPSSVGYRHPEVHNGRAVLRVRCHQPELSAHPGDSPFGEPAHLGAYETGSHPHQYRTRPVSGRRGGSRSPEKQYPCRIRCRRDKHRTAFGRPSPAFGP